MDFIHRAEQILGTEIRVLSGREEAHYSALGVISGFHPANGIAGDLGGGSLELVDVNGMAIGEGITLPLGGLRLQDLSKGSLADRRRNSCASSWAARNCCRAGEGRPFYAVGGTWRNLARLHMNAINYPLAVMHHYELGIDKLGRVPAPGRARRNGQDQGHRAGLQEPPHAAALWRHRAAGDHRGDEALEDHRVGAGRARGLPLFAAVAGRTAVRSADFGVGGTGAARARSVTHAHELADWTGATFAAFGIDETEDEVRYRRAACLLADIGWRAHPEYRGTQSLNIIAHASFIGVDHPGRAFIALANLYRHEGIFDDSAATDLKALATPRYADRARVLGAMLRVVYLLSASMPGDDSEAADGSAATMARWRWSSRPRIAAWSASGRPAGWRSWRGSPASAWSSWPGRGSRCWECANSPSARSLTEASRTPPAAASRT